jgi:hypothetical protein
MMVRTLLVAAIAALAWPSQANAQIYAWRDAAGNLVLSDRRLDASAATYEVPAAPTFRATRPLESNDALEQLSLFSGNTRPARASVRISFARSSRWNRDSIRGRGRRKARWG